MLVPNADDLRIDLAAEYPPDTWEVSIVHDTASRLPVARGVALADLGPAIAEAQRRIEAGEHFGSKIRKGSVCITRSDCTTEAKQLRWAQDFYDLDRAGRKRRRFKRPQIEKDWEEWAKEQRRLVREAAQVANASR